MVEKRWITGEEILERWQAAPFEFVGVVLSKGLTAVDLGTGKRFEWKETDRRTPQNSVAQCFFCTKLGDNPVCYNTFWEDPYSDEDVLCSSVDWEMADGGRDYWRIDFVKRLCFNISEVQAYEQAHGLGPLPHKPDTAEALAETLRAAGITDAEMVARMVKAAEIEVHGMKPATTSHTATTGNGQQVGIPQVDPPEALPATTKEYNEQLIERGFSDEAARAYMIRNAQGKWGKVTNYAAMAIATGQPLPGRNAQAEKDRLNSSYTERVHYGLLGKPRPIKKKQS
ncbi:hypothetical protein NLA06_12650 [Desulfomicrobium sp. ZS1]|uniref:hypothetical protein n=1 Tax=Desulfomicrobium sp. ZS1 TaxID=2952228 RepID=UPI0020B1CB2B|nr:hypothetical protein [Desulfomicrobium sp. ZS1]UTF49406.1 hypothetical protein NLA06_12650 [Desulfomicrobium sp. ZS1]